MKKFILSGFVLLAMGCGSARMVTFDYDNAGKVIRKSEVKYTAVGSRGLKGVDVNIIKGKVKIGSQTGNAGDLGKAFLNLTEIAKDVTKKATLIP